jgi:hypothetical protein
MAAQPWTSEASDLSEILGMVLFVEPLGSSPVADVF